MPVRGQQRDAIPDGELYLAHGAAVVSSRGINSDDTIGDAGDKAVFVNGGRLLIGACPEDDLVFRILRCHGGGKLKRFPDLHTVHVAGRRNRYGLNEYAIRASGISRALSECERGTACCAVLSIDGARVQRGRTDIALCHGHGEGGGICRGVLRGVYLRICTERSIITQPDIRQHAVIHRRGRKRDRLSGGSVHDILIYKRLIAVVRAGEGDESRLLRFRLNSRFGFRRRFRLRGGFRFRCRFNDGRFRYCRLLRGGGFLHRGNIRLLHRLFDLFLYRLLRKQLLPVSLGPCRGNKADEHRRAKQH